MSYPQDPAAPGRAIARFAVAALLLGASVMLSACNTTAGAGQDVSAAGHAVTNTADQVKSKL
jgi:predicted small secreted protein